MRLTRSLARGFMGQSFMDRSVDELKRMSLYAFKGEAMKDVPTPLELFNFHHRQSLNGCRRLADSDLGGSSRAQLDWVPPSTNPDSPSENKHGYARFHGTISNELPLDKPDVHRTGYAAWRTGDQGYTVLGKAIWNIDPFLYLALRLKSDGRRYYVNVQTESIVPTDIHQHRLYTRRPGEWETVLIKWNEFVRTNHGAVVEPQSEILRQKVKTVGIGCTDRLPGTFNLCIERIWATSQLSESEILEDGRVEQGQFTTKHGRKLSGRQHDGVGNTGSDVFAR